MEYSNPEIPEGINYSKTHPLKEFVLLTGGVLGLLLVIFALLAFFADKLAHHIPFSMEKDIDSFVISDADKNADVSAYLQQLADRIAQTQALEEGMVIKVHYVDSDVVNAYATLGGNVIFFRGLLEKMSHENALAMVMAHEIAHVKHRHPIRSLGKGIVIGMAISLVNSSMGDAMIGDIVGNTGMVTILKYSRDHENEADDTALASLTQLYGHVNGADELFKYIHDRSHSEISYQPEFLTTHPDIARRIAKIEAMSLARQPVLQPLPVEFKQWLKHHDADGKEEKEK